MEIADRVERGERRMDWGVLADAEPVLEQMGDKRLEKVRAERIRRYHLEEYYADCL